VARWPDPNEAIVQKLVQWQQAIPRLCLRSRTNFIESGRVAQQLTQRDGVRIRVRDGDAPNVAIDRGIELHRAAVDQLHYGARGTCHPNRRKWRSERRHLPTKAVAVAGGWTDLVTMERCYDLPDGADLLAVTTDTNKRRETLPRASTAMN